MKILALYFLLSFSFSSNYMACSFSNNFQNTSTETEEYQHLSVDEPIKKYLGQKIWLEGKQAIEVYQHLMKPSFSFDGEVEEKHLFVDYNNDKQVVVYYKDIKMPQDQKKHKFYGTVQSISGAGKGGGTHTEYYLNLDKVE